jgi:hypothetical protein
VKVDFATFCHAGDVHRLHAPGQLKRQVESNNFEFENVFLIYQNVPISYGDYAYKRLRKECNFKNLGVLLVDDIDANLEYCGIDILKPQYMSNTDNAHHWKYHVVNHIHYAKCVYTNSDYIVFADNDCWMVKQPEDESWVEMGIWILDNNPTAFIVSPNDGEPERRTQRFSQQMFLARVDEFRNADFNQPEWDGNVNIPGGPMPEYWAMLEGRMELHCRVTGQYRYVLGPEYRYWHFNKLTENDMFETDLSKY